MDVFVSAPGLKLCNLMFPDGSVVRDVVKTLSQKVGAASLEDFYVIRNGRLSYLEDPLQHGAIYHLEPRLCGGKGGFGSMLRALGAQIEKTTNREACRDLSGRRLRDVNHEKEMVDWLKKQSEREAEKEQRRLERIQRKLSEPKHHFTDPEYQQQCHDLSERLEDSVIKGLQASSSSQVKVDEVTATKRVRSDESEQPQKKQKTAAAGCFWMGVDELDELQSSEDEAESQGACSSSCEAAATAAAITMVTPTEAAKPEHSKRPVPECSSSSDDEISTPSEKEKPPETRKEPSIRPVQNPSPSEPSREPADKLSEAQKAPETSATSEEPSCSSQQQKQERQSLLDLSSVSSADQLESLGLDVLKEELMSRGLKCGGTAAERAARLFSIRGLTPDQISPALLAKPAKTVRK
ncbi:uncharacterized protein V6R79_002691 [Siganus canaliculatus]